MKTLSLIASLVSVLAFTSLAFAEPPERERRRPRRGPPPEALAVCVDAQEGAACSFESPRGTLEGSCRMVREEKLACVPKNHRRRGPRDRRQRRQDRNQDQDQDQDQ